MRAGTVIREEVGLTLDKADKEVLGHAAKVVLTKDSTTIVGDGSTQDAVSKRVAQIKNLIEVSNSRLIIASTYLVLSCILLLLKFPSDASLLGRRLIKITRRKS